MSRTAIYTKEEYKVHRNELARAKRLLESEETKKIRYEKQKIWNAKNPDKIKEYIFKNKDKVLENSKIWQKNNRDKGNAAHLKYRNKDKERYKRIVKANKEKNKEQYLETVRNWKKERKKTDFVYKFNEGLRANITGSFKRNNKNFKKPTKTELILGCSMLEFKDYILSKVPEGITLKDFKIDGYHLDHIIPISSANTVEDIVKLNHYTNFQPLWWEDNLEKSNKIEDKYNNII